jgi:hypothetical protein
MRKNREAAAAKQAAVGGMANQLNSEAGEAYYFNQTTNKTTWDRPVATPAAAPGRGASFMVILIFDEFILSTSCRGLTD